MMRALLLDYFHHTCAIIFFKFPFIEWLRLKEKTRNILPETFAEITELTHIIEIHKTISFKGGQ